MTELHAKPIIDGKYWVIEENGERIATLQKRENNKFLLSNNNGEILFNKKEDLTREFGKDFFLTNKKIKLTSVLLKEVHGYPTSSKPYNSMFDVRRKLPLFTKSNQSKSLYCAGYYIIKFDKGWVKSFCPKLITIERYPSKGPFKSEFEMKLELSNAKSD